MKITAIHQGGDWVDASVDYLVIPEGMDLTKERDAWKQWYWAVYMKTAGEKYVEFVEWLRAKGARSPNTDELEVFEP